MQNRLILLVVIVLLFFTSFSLQAQCLIEYGDQQQVFVLNMNDISLGSDIPVGSRVSSSARFSSSVLIISCDKLTQNTQLRFKLGVLDAPLGMSSSVENSFNTNVPGLSASIDIRMPKAINYQVLTSASESLFGDTDSTFLPSGKTQIIVQGTNLFYVGVHLHKSGDIPVGSVFDASSLPSLYLQLIQKDNGEQPVLTLPFDVSNYAFVGTQVVDSQTCTIENTVSVDLGGINIHEQFNSIGSATPWHQFAVRFTNCPSFSGYTSRDGPVKNAFNIRFEGANGQRGDNFYLPEGDSVAKGVALNLAYFSANGGETGYLGENVSDLELAIWSMGQGMLKLLPPPPPDGSSDLVLPLAVRYKQISDKVTPGIADGQVYMLVEYH